MFQGANEYMTFQQILSFPRDYVWHDTVGSLSKNLIIDLLKQEVDERLGMKSYDEIKSHSFFASATADGSVQWDMMHAITPPQQAHRRVLAEPKYDGANPSWILEDIKDDMDAANDMEAMDLIGSNRLHRQSSEMMSGYPGARGSANRAEADVVGDWGAFLRPGESVTMSGLVGKKNRAWVTRKRYFLLIEGGDEPRFVYCSPDQLVLKGDIEYHPQMKVELKTSDRWTLEVPGRTYLWLCMDGTPAKEWVDVVLGVLDRAK